MTGLTESEIERFSRQIKLSEFGREGQRRLSEARVLVLGVGGLGSPVIMYLAAAGVGCLILTDFDRVEPSNLQRQVIFDQRALGELKATSAKHRVQEINPDVVVVAFDYQLDFEELLEQARSSDVLVDCTDNFPSRFEANRASLMTGTPLVSGAAIRWQGQMATFDPNSDASPCYQCLYPDENIETVTCEAEGIVGPVVGMIGCVQAVEVIKIALGLRPGLLGRVMLFDGLAMECQTIALTKKTNCPACGTFGPAGGIES